MFLAFSLHAGEQLNLFIWSEYIPPDVVSEFENRFQCKVVIDLYEDAESMLAKVEAGGGSLYDVIVPSDYIVTALARQNLLAPLRKENLPNLSNIDAKFLNPPFDPGNKYTAAYQWGTVGIYLRKPPAGTRIDPSWGLVFDPAKQAGKFVLIDSMRDLIGAALKYQGHSLNSTVPSELKEARDLLIQAKSRSVALAGSVAGKNKVLDHSASAAVVYSGEAARGMADDPNTMYLIPKEGSQIWLDSMAILAHAPHRELAEKFINFVLEPEIGARISNYTEFSTPNRKSKAMIKPELLKNPAIYPDEAAMGKLEFLKDLGKNTRIYDQLWTQIKSH
jgi:spermidine/putrescine transport system substrate-binding protein